MFNDDGHIGLKRSNLNCVLWAVIWFHFVRVLDIDGGYEKYLYYFEILSNVLK